MSNHTNPFTVIMGITAYLVVAAQFSSTPEPKFEKRQFDLTSNTGYYFSKEKNTELQVTITGYSIQMESNAEIVEKRLSAEGYKKFSRQGRRGVSMVSGKPHTVCVVNIRNDEKGDKITSSHCSPSKG